jgi:3-deoxy-7-phosphoheptulonate synthase
MQQSNATGDASHTQSPRPDPAPARDTAAPIPPARAYRLAQRSPGQATSRVHVGDVPIGGNLPVVIGGPCSVESEEQLLVTAEAVREAGGQILRGGAFKPRTSPYAFSGLGEEGLVLLAAARARTGLPVVTEVIEPGDVNLVARYADMLQIGSRNMQNYPLLRAVGRQKKPILLKRGLAATIEEWLLAAEYILAEGNDQVVLCERGVRGFDSMLRNQLDLSAVPLLRELTHLPVIVDPSHATGKRSLIQPMSLAAIAAGAAGLIIEVHPSPDNAWSDAAQTVDLHQFAGIMQAVRTIARATAPFYQ